MEKCRICAVPDQDILLRTAYCKAFYFPQPIDTAHIAVAVQAHKPSLTDLAITEAQDLIVLTQRIAATCVTQLGLEKCYIAAIGDVDAHFHFHLIPKRTTEPNLGPFIFGPNGWASTRAAPINEEERQALRKALRPPVERRL